MITYEATALFHEDTLCVSLCVVCLSGYVNLP